MLQAATQALQRAAGALCPTNTCTLHAACGCCAGCVSCVSCVCLRNAHVFFCVPMLCDRQPESRFRAPNLRTNPRALHRLHQRRLLLQQPLQVWALRPQHTSAALSHRAVTAATMPPCHPGPKWRSSSRGGTPKQTTLPGTQRVREVVIKRHTPARVLQAVPVPTRREPVARVQQPALPRGLLAFRCVCSWQA